MGLPFHGGGQRFTQHASCGLQLFFVAASRRRVLDSGVHSPDTSAVAAPASAATASSRRISFNCRSESARTCLARVCNSAAMASYRSASKSRVRTRRRSSSSARRKRANSPCRLQNDLHELIPTQADFTPNDVSDFGMGGDSATATRRCASARTASPGASRWLFQCHASSAARAAAFAGF